MRATYKEMLWPATADKGSSPANSSLIGEGPGVAATAAPIHMVLVLGLPGAGKTAVLQQYLLALAGQAWQPFTYGLVCGRTYASPHGSLFILGSEGPTGFAGTGAWSMLVAADMPRFVAGYLRAHAPCTVVAEGCHVFSSHLLDDTWRYQVSLSLIELEAADGTLVQRTTRTAQMSSRTVRARLKRLCQTFAPHYPYYLLPNEHEEHLQENAQVLAQIIARGTYGR